MIRSAICLLTVSLALTFITQAQAGHGCDGADGCGCHVQCPSCNHYCKLSIDTEKVEKYCWETECKPICIPRVHFPWDCLCPPKCAKIKYVNTLKKHTYECEECAYSWSPEEMGCGANGCCGDGNCDGSCDAGCATSVEVVAPIEAQPEPADAASMPEPPAPLTGQRPTWFDSAKSSAKSTVALPVNFLRAAKRQAEK